MGSQLDDLDCAGNITLLPDTQIQMQGHKVTELKVDTEMTKINQANHNLISLS